MSFRKYGGINYNAKHNNVTSNYNNANNYNVMDFFGQNNSYNIFESDIIAKGGIRVVENVDISGNLTVDGITQLNNKTYVNDTLDVTGDTRLYNNLMVDGITQLNNKTYVNSTLDVVGDTKLYNNLTVDGITQLNNKTYVNNILDVSGNLTINGDTNLNGFANIRDNLNVNAINLTSNQITSNENGVVPKSYVDAIGTGATPVTPCNCATVPTTSANLNLTSLPSPFIVDDYVVQNGDRILVKNQDQIGTPTDINYSTNSVNNGIYIYNSSTNSLTRASDYNAGFNAESTTTFIQNGTVNSKIIYIQLSTPALVGTDPLQYAVFYTIQLNLGQGLEYVPVNVLQVKNNLDFVTDVGTLNSLTVDGNITIKNFSGSSNRSIRFSGNTDEAIINFVSNSDNMSYLQIGTGDNATTGFDEPIYFTQYEVANNITYPRIRITGADVFINPSGDPNFPNSISTSSYALNVNGNLAVSGQITNNATQPSATNSSTIVPTTSWIQNTFRSSGSVIFTQTYSFVDTSLQTAYYPNSITMLVNNFTIPVSSDWIRVFRNATDFIPRNVPYNTYLFIEITCLYWKFGTRRDQNLSRINVFFNNQNNQTGYGYQRWEDGSGGGTRSGTLFPINAAFNLTSNWTLPIQIIAEVYNVSGTTDDVIYLFTEHGNGLKNISIKVTQIVS